MEKVELSEIDAELFIKFQEKYKQFKELFEEGVFDVKGGSVIIDFDCGGNVCRIIRQLYSKRYDPKLS